MIGLRLIPVLDVQNGVVVRAIGGRRSEYQPLTSRLTASTHPRDVATALLTVTGGRELYIADLDAILGKPTAPAVAELVDSVNAHVWLDAGIGHPDRIAGNPRVTTVIGFESAHSPSVLAQTLSARGPNHVALSIDLKDGELLGDWRRWGLAGSRDVLGLSAQAVAMGVRRFLLIDLARVGGQAGCGSERLIGDITGEWPTIELLVGGGVGGMSDVPLLFEAGADGVLVASALHDGLIP